MRIVDRGTMVRGAIMFVAVKPETLCGACRAASVAEFGVPTLGVGAAGRPPYGLCGAKAPPGDAAAGVVFRLGVPSPPNVGVVEPRPPAPVLPKRLGVA